MEFISIGRHYKVIDELKEKYHKRARLAGFSAFVVGLSFGVGLSLVGFIL